MRTTTAPRTFGATWTISGLGAAYWALRLGAALCFIGHGAFGFMTKAAWVPYFGVAGIPEAWAWRLMPLVGAVDVTMGMAVLFAPRALPLAYMAVWATWTALLRPLAGESMFEALERAGNYGVPIALLMLTWTQPSRRTLASLLAAPVADAQRLATVERVLTWTTALLLFGHGALGAFIDSAVLTSHYAAIGLGPETTALIGWAEIALAVAVMVRPVVPLLVMVVAWKLATESLFIAAGAPIWEFVERAGSYAAPLALAALFLRDQRPETKRSTATDKGGRGRESAKCEGRAPGGATPYEIGARHTGRPGPSHFPFGLPSSLAG